MKFMFIVLHLAYFRFLLTRPLASVPVGDQVDTGIFGYVLF